MPMLNGKYDFEVLTCPKSVVQFFKSYNFEIFQRKTMQFSGGKL